ncbi:transporter substrate-binding domain-containing protein [Streptomyces sp. NPDC006514]|uniref:transporter substrate-binding domain-containing protein n=1 Tax=Streptomyces sp. NPDC006514 TaxID=3154308 RepID=UPI0033BF958E
MFMTSRGRGIALTLIALASLTSGCCSDDRSQPSIFEQNRLVIGVKNDQPGTSVWEHYKRTGFDIQVAYHLTKAEGIAPNKNVFNDISSDDRLPALKDDRVDLVIATFSITDARLEEIDFVGPYAVTKQGFLVRKGGPPIKSSDDLKGKAVCTWPGTTSDDVLKTQYPQIQRTPGTDAQDCINKLKSDAVTAVSTDQLILYGFARQDPTVEVADATVGSPNNYGIGIAKDHKAECKDLAAKVMEYVTNSDWQKDFTASFPDLAAGDRWKEFQPKPQDVGCHEKPRK